MSENKLHPSVEEFKHFMNDRPKLVLRLRENGHSLQTYYNKWVEHGEDESVWQLGEKQSRETNRNDNDLFNQIIKYTENIDVDKIQGHVKQLNKMLGVVQSILHNFAGSKNTTVDQAKQMEVLNLFRD